MSPAPAPIIRATALSGAPVPLVVLEHTVESWELDLDDLLGGVKRALGTITMELLHPGCRGVGADRLPQVLQTGVDVTPTDAPIWVHYVDKAVEYGEADKLVEVYDVGQLARSCCEVPVWAPQWKQDRIAASYPTRTVTADGKRFRFSRLPANDTRMGTAYEVDFCRWIPGDPLEALRLLIVCGPAGGNLVERIQAVLRANEPA